MINLAPPPPPSPPAGGGPPAGEPAPAPAPAPGKAPIGGGGDPLCIAGVGGAPVGPADMVAALAGRKGGGMPPGGGRKPVGCKKSGRVSHFGNPIEERAPERRLTWRRHRHSGRRRSAHPCREQGRQSHRRQRRPGEGQTHLESLQREADRDHPPAAAAGTASAAALPCRSCPVQEEHRSQAGARPSVRPSVRLRSALSVRKTGG